MSHKRFEYIWWHEGLRVPMKQPKRGPLWFNDGSCIRLGPCWPNNALTYDFVLTRTHDGRAFGMLTIIDEYSRECLAILAARRIRSDDILYLLTKLFADRGPPGHIRSDNGPEFTVKAAREWLRRIDVKTLFIEPETVNSERPDPDFVRWGLHPDKAFPSVTNGLAQKVDQSMVQARGRA